MSEQSIPPVSGENLPIPARMLFRWFVSLLLLVALMLTVSTFLAAGIKGMALEAGRQQGADTAWLDAAAQALTTFNVFLNGFISKFWDFLAPLLSVAVLLLIVDWFLRRMGLRIEGVKDLGSANVQAIIAVVVIGSLCLAAFANSAAASLLKDLALVVVGFYFGTRSKPETPSG